MVLNKHEKVYRIYICMKTEIFPRIDWNSALVKIRAGENENVSLLKNSKSKVNDEFPYFPEFQAFF